MTLFGTFWRAYTRTHDGKSPFASGLGIVYVVSWLLLAPIILLFALTFMFEAFNGNAAQALSAFFFLIIVFAPILPRTERR